ncbi:SDR family NAD(P)-dependent oxidoreductase [Subtercola endophyticus]|uniref:SDR family NAD(P)-dependent oxidoreductase n=1 Tax=Subtercola endophyticus TaxID=2895559 RepID=UPI001E562C93|nr:SDR family NAD(P)-dependent oxidoreductase [Subtercola endophyticus]UFS59434.1 SDR family NAD(P)-dependent oxidoreductase [Subtercola endophyticus]
MPKTIVITGSSDGIGAAAARRLSLDGHTVVIVGRSAAKTEAIARELGSDYFIADFACLDDVRTLATDLAAHYPRIDVLANNAGGVFGDKAPTADGFEKTFQINHLAPFLLTNLLLPRLTSSRATLIQTSSDAARITGKLVIDDLNNTAGRTPTRAYGDAKLANILFTAELQRRYGDQGIAAAAFHPGTVATNFASDTPSRAMRFVYGNPIIRRLITTPAKGAAQLVWLATTDPGTAWQPGSYFEKGRPARKTNPQAGSVELARELWEASSTMVGFGEVS